MKTHNEYAATLGPLYDQIPKAVFAAIAVSALTTGGDHIEHAVAVILYEWGALHRAGIVPQKPTRDVAPEDLPEEVRP